MVNITGKSWETASFCCIQKLHCAVTEFRAHWFSLFTEASLGAWRSIIAVYVFKSLTTPVLCREIRSSFALLLLLPTRPCAMSPIPSLCHQPPLSDLQTPSLLPHLWREDVNSQQIFPQRCYSWKYFCSHCFAACELQFWVSWEESLLSCLSAGIAIATLAQCQWPRFLSAPSFWTDSSDFNAPWTKSLHAETALEKKKKSELLIRAGCSLSFLPKKRVRKAFSMASLSAPLKSQMDNDHKAVSSLAISISRRVIRHHGNDACRGLLFYRYLHLQAGRLGVQCGNRNEAVIEATQTPSWVWEQDWDSGQQYSEKWGRLLYSFEVSQRGQYLNTARSVSCSRVPQWHLAGHNAIVRADLWWKLVTWEMGKQSQHLRMQFRARSPHGGATCHLTTSTLHPVCPELPVSQHMGRQLDTAQAGKEIKVTCASMASNPSAGLVLGCRAATAPRHPLFLATVSILSPPACPWRGSMSHCPQGTERLAGGGWPREGLWRGDTRSNGWCIERQHPRMLHLQLRWARGCKPHHVHLPQGEINQS